MKKKVSLLLLLALWGGLTVFAWFGPRTEISESERRPLAQFPQVSVRNILNGTFMSEFETFSLDQFPPAGWFPEPEIGIPSAFSAAMGQ